MNLFTPNNHSNYKIEWAEAGQEKRREIEPLITGYYGFDRVAEIKQVKEWEKMSNNFRMLATKNGKLREILFRKHIQLKDKESVAFLSKAFLFLNDQGVATSRQIPTLAGDLFFESGGFFYQAFDFIDGDHFKGSKKELKEAARGIARLHQALAKASFLEEIKKKPALLTPWSLEGWNEMRELSKSKNGKENDIFIENADFILETAKSVQVFFSSGNSFRLQPIHCDLHPQNFIFKDEKLLAILDFEGLRIGELARDIANACHRMVRQYVVFSGGDRRKYLPKGVRLFLEEYSKLNPISDKEKRAMPVFIKDEILRKLFKDLGKFYFDGEGRYIAGGELEKKLNLLAEASEIEKALSGGDF